MRCNLLIQIFALNKRVKRPGGSHEGVGRKKKNSGGRCGSEQYQPLSMAVVNRLNRCH